MLVKDFFAVVRFSMFVDSAQGTIKNDVSFEEGEERRGGPDDAEMGVASYFVIL